MTTCTLVFPNQLFDRHPALRKDREVVLVEDSLFFGDPHHPVRFHRQKLVLHRASMRAYARRLEAKGHRARVLEYGPDRVVTADGVVRDLADAGVREIVCADPEDFLLMKRLRRATSARGVALSIVESPMFLASPAWIEEFFGDSRGGTMARFYMAQRRRLGVLMDGAKPRGGKWSFDADNRKRLPAGLVAPDVPAIRQPRETADAIAWVDRAFPGNPGRASDFWFPVTHEQARAWLDSFLERRFAAFGDYEDAISAGQDTLFHSVLTPALNIGLLTPRDVLDAALARADRGGVPLNAVEGFVRQIIGWREFIRAMYRRHGVEMRTRNFWLHERPLPESFYSGTTGLDPVDLVVRRVDRLAWCHHIERLMVLSNAMLLCGIRPDDAYRWFMEMFIDAYDWVMVPNVYGMGLFADGGLFATKPYISGSAYLRKMSDIPKGAWCDAWDALYWNFIAEHRAFFDCHPRLAVMPKTWDRFSPDRQQNLRRRALGALAALAA